MFSKLSCGSDGKLYNNGCQMMRKNCGKHVYEVPAPFCLNKLYRTKCPTNCDKENRGAKPVCGSDGQLYASKCELEKLTCGFPLTRRVPSIVCYMGVNRLISQMTSS